VRSPLAQRHDQPAALLQARQAGAGNADGGRARDGACASLLALDAARRSNRHARRGEAPVVRETEALCRACCAAGSATRKRLTRSRALEEECRSARHHVENPCGEKGRRQTRAALLEPHHLEQHLKRLNDAVR